MSDTDKRDETITLACPECDAVFHPWARHKDAKYCSRACRTRASLRTLNGTTDPAQLEPRECPQCHQGFTPPADHRRQLYCSMTCYKQSRHTPQREVRTCPRCGQAFIPRRPPQRYCSQLCVRGHALDTITIGARTGEAAREKLRSHLLRRRAAEGRTLESYRRDGTSAHTESADLAPVITSATLPEELPPLPLIPKDATSEASDAEPTLPTDGPGAPLTFPLTGHAARQEWLQIGELREIQTMRALRREELRTPEGRTVVLAGQGSFLGVEGTALVCHQGRTHGVPAPERELLYPAVHNVRRIIWIGAHGHQTGTMTLAAAAWCQAEGIALTVLDSSGEPLLVTVPEERYDAQLHRQQWLVNAGYVTPPAGVIARELVRRKLESQHAVLLAHDELPGRAQFLPTLSAWREWLKLRDVPAWQFNVSHMVQIEARLALAYFRAWEGWPLRWTKADAKRVPPHWLVVRSRTSPLAPKGNARHAIDPLNACLNYCYGCLASQCRQALLAEGFDLACGFLHADKAGRDSLTFDLMELERGAVDGLVLDFLGKVTLHYGDFARSADGSIMLHPQLARLLLASCRVPQTRVDGHAKWLRRFLLMNEAQARFGSESGREDRPAE